MILLDTDVLIEHFKENPKITEKLLSFGFKNLVISIVSVYEMYIGALNKKELYKIKRYLDKFPQLIIEKKLSVKAKELIFQYNLSHTLYINDALIASTALVHDFKFYTLNIKDFKFIPGLKLVS